MDTPPRPSIEATPTGRVVTPASHRRESELSRQAIRGTLWTYLSFGLSRGLSFVAMIVLARLLTPAEFGLMAYCLTAFMYFETFSTFGTHTAIISRRDRFEEAANAAFLISVATGVLLYGLAWMLAPGVAAFFREDALTDLLRVLALALPIGALGSVSDAVMQRDLRFKARLMPEFLWSFVRMGLSVLFAWQGYSVWGLVLGHVAGGAVAVALTWVLAGWRPTPVFHGHVTRELLVFGSHIILINMIGALLGNVDYLLIGRLLGSAALGYYTVAYRIPDLLVSNTNYVVARVAHPLFSRLQCETNSLRELYFSYVRYLTLFTFPLGAGIAAMAQPFITVVYSSQWEPAVPLMQYIAIAIAVASIGHISGVVYKAINRPDILNRLALVKLPLAVAALWYSLGWGIEGVALCQIAIALVNVVLDVVVISRFLDFRAWAILGPLAPAIIGSVAMSGVAFMAAQLLSSHAVLALIVACLCGVIVYGSVLVVLSRDAVVQACLLVRAALVRD